MRYLRSLVLSFFLLVSFTLPALAGPPEVDLAAGYYNGYETIRGQIKIDGQVLKTDVPPVVIKGRVMLPVRAVAQALGAKVDYVPQTQAAYIVKGDRTIVFYGGSNKFQYNNAWMPMDVQVQTINGRYMVPLRYLGMFLDYAISYDEVTGDVNANSGPDVPVTKPVEPQPQPKPPATESPTPSTTEPQPEEPPIAEPPIDNQELVGLPPNTYTIVSQLNNITVDGVKISTSVPALTVKGPVSYSYLGNITVTMVPMVDVAKALGADVQMVYDKISNKTSPYQATITLDNIELSIRRGYNTGRSNFAQDDILIAIPPCLYQNHMMVDIGLLARVFHFDVTSDSQTVNINMGQKSPQSPTPTQPPVTKPSNNNDQYLNIKPDEYYVVKTLGNVYLNNKRITTKVPAVAVKGPTVTGLSYIQQNFVPIVDLARADGYNVQINGNQVTLDNGAKKVILEAGSRYYDSRYSKDGVTMHGYSMDMPALALNGQLIVEGIAAGKILDLTPDFNYDDESYNYFTWDYNKNKGQDLLEPEPSAPESDDVQPTTSSSQESTNPLTIYQVPELAPYKIIGVEGKIKVNGQDIGASLPGLDITGPTYGYSPSKTYTRTFVPVEDLAKALGFKVRHEGENMYFNKDGLYSMCSIGGTRVQALHTVDSKEKYETDYPISTVIVNNHLMATLEVTNLLFGIKVEYNQTDKSFDFKTQ